MAKLSLPFSRLSICSLVKDVRFLCSFRLSLSRAWSSSPPAQEPGLELSPPEAVSSLCTLSRSITKGRQRERPSAGLDYEEFVTISTRVVGDQGNGGNSVPPYRQAAAAPRPHVALETKRSRGPKGWGSPSSRLLLRLARPRSAKGRARAGLSRGEELMRFP